MTAIVPAAQPPRPAGREPAIAPTVSVVIPCRNEAAYIEHVLDALRAQDAAPSEVVIADGGSTDATPAVVARYVERHPAFPVRIVDAHGANISAALNLGIAASRGDVIVRMDAHSRPAPDYVRKCVAALETTPAAVAGGVWKICPSAASATATAIAHAVSHRLGAGDAAYRLSPSGGIRVVDTVPFGCFRRSHWESLGGYNEHLLVNEDYEFNYRTRLRGGTIALDPAVRCEYFARPTLGSLARQYFRYGWWKGRMLRIYPRSIRVRQAIPGLFVPFWIAAGAVAAAFPAARLLVAAALALYVVALCAGAASAARGHWRLVPPMVVAFAIIHTAWSAGLWLVFLTGSSALGRRRPGGRRPRVGITGGQLAGALVAIAVLGVLLPFALATRVHAQRIARAHQQVEAIASAVRGLPVTAAPGNGDRFVFVTPGVSPVYRDPDWRQVQAVALPPSILPPMTDPWGNHFIVFPRGGNDDAPAARWVVSAGPNGILETPFRQPGERGALAGDDIGVRLD